MKNFIVICVCLMGFVALAACDLSGGGGGGSKVDITIHNPPAPPSESSE